MSRAEARFRAPREGDAEELEANLRMADSRELTALGLPWHLKAIKDSLAHSTGAATVEDQHGVVAMLGVGPISNSILAPVGAPWMMGTERSYLHTRTLVKMGPAYTREMLKAYPRLMNIVHEDNTLHIGWLQRLGFRFRPGVVRLPTGANFLVFEMGVDDV